MNTIKLFCTLMIFALGTSAFAQNANETKDDKKEKKITIIKKTIDEDGNEVIEKIVKEGDETENLMWIDNEGNTFEFDENMNFNFDDFNFNFDFKDLGDVKIFGDDFENLDILKLELGELENLDSEIREKMKNMNIEIKELGDNKTVWIHGDEDGNDFNFEWSGDELSEEVIEKLKEKGIKIDENGVIKGENFDFNFGNIWIDKDDNEHNLDEGDNTFFFHSAGDHDFVGKSKSIVIIKKKGEGNSYEVTIDTDDSEAEDRNEETEVTESKDLTLEMVNIFPNPTNGVVQIQFKGEAVPTKVTVTDISGKTIFKDEINNFDGNYNTQIDVSDAAKGTLLLTVSQGKKNFTEKIILE